MYTEPIGRLGLTIDETAEALGCCRRTVCNLIAAGELTSFRVGRLRRIPPEALDAFVERHTECRQVAAS